MCFKTANPLETKNIGKALGTLLGKGDVLLITGDLGAGKTTFIQGLAEGLGVKAQVTSPTFTIIHEYPGIIPLYHIDAYRLEKEAEILELGLEDYFYGNGITAIEWPEKLHSWLPEDAIEINIKKTEDQNDGRLLFFTGHGKKGYQELLEELKQIAGIGH